MSFLRAVFSRSTSVREKKLEKKLGKVYLYSMREITKAFYQKYLPMLTVSISKFDNLHNKLIVLND